MLPVIGSLSILLFRIFNSPGHLSAGFSLLVLLCSSILIYRNLNEQIYLTFDWFKVGGFQYNVGLLLDNVSMIMLLVVSLITFLVTVFSIEYMGKDHGKDRYFMFLGLFAFSMYGIVISSNLFLTFCFWELVGFSSYLLIGFWYQENEPPKASIKAFIMNRIGDSGFLIGLFLLFAFFQTFELPELWEIFRDQASTEGPGSGMLYVLGIGLFLGAVGKSAQFPLQTWLPDAMAGPTPVSALIHAATMVAAGVYMLFRVFPLMSIEVLNTIAVVGSITAFMGAFAAFAQNDIKKVLAYSTISQLGYMVIGIGVGAPQFALFHLITHAFFKACLFLCSGSIIHYMHSVAGHGHDPQDMQLMGGLKQKLPVTFVAYSVSMLALCGIPFFSGYFSKEAIVLSSIQWSFDPSSPTYGFLVSILALISVMMTATYMGRQYFMVFFGSKKFTDPKADMPAIESGYFKLPLIILAAGSTWVFFAFNPLEYKSFWLMEQLNRSEIDRFTQKALFINHASISIISLLLAVGGLLLAFLIYKKRKLLAFQKMVYKRLGSLSMNNWFLDYFYEHQIIRMAKSSSAGIATFDRRIVDGIVNISGIGGVIISQITGWFDKHVVDGLVVFITDTTRTLGNMVRHIQGGNIQAYFVWAVIGILLTFLLII